MTKGRGDGPEQRSGGTTRAPASGDTRAHEDRRAKAKERRRAEQQRRRARERRRRLRTWGLVALAAAAVAGLVALRVARNAAEARRAEALGQAAGCGKVTKVGGLSQGHLQPGEPAPRYATSPPVGGPHAPAPLSAGVYNDPLSEDLAATGPTIYQAVHSLEHGYVVVWYQGLTDAQVDQLSKAFENERKVIVAPYPRLDRGEVALTAWGRLQTCERPDTTLIRSFITRFRERTAPEPGAP